MDTYRQQISVIEPIGLAFNCVKAILFLVIMVGLATCGCACCFMSIPFVGTVLLLPISVFMRSYSLLYLRQFGSAYDSFAVNTSPASGE